jgi:hypothetical protein
MLRTQTADELSVIQWFMAEEKDADALRAPYLLDQEMLLSFYMNHRQQPLPQGLEWMSGELLADSMLLVESLVPNIANSIFGGKSISVDAFTLAGSDVNKALDKGLYRMRRQANFEFGAVPSIRMAAILGHQIQENIWVTEWGTKRTPIMSNPSQNAFGEEVPGAIVDWKLSRTRTFDGPRTFYPDTAKVWKSAATNMLGESLVQIKEISLDYDYMKDVNDEYEADYGEPFYVNMAELGHKHRTQLASSANSYGNAGYDFGARQQSSTEQASNLSGNQLNGSNSITMRQGWARVPKHIRDYGDQPQERLVIYTADGILLRDIPMPTWNMSSPMHDIKFMQVANEAYGRTPLWWCLSEIEQRSELRNLRVAEAWLNIFQTRIKNRNANWDNNDFGLVPGGVMTYDSDENIRPQDAIMNLPRHPVLQEAYREDSLSEEHINRVMGSTPNMQGEGLGQRATLGEAQLVDSRAGGRVDLIGRQLAHQYEVPAGKDYLGMFAAFSDRPLEVQIDGEQGSFPVQIFAEEIDFDYDVVVNAGEWGILNGQSLNALRETFGLVMNSPEAVFEVDARAAISHFQHRTGMDNILKPRQQAENERQQAQQMQLAEMAASRSGGAQG